MQQQQQLRWGQTTTQQACAATWRPFSLSERMQQ
jgi:hypothetical protein